MFNKNWPVNFTKWAVWCLGAVAILTMECKCTDAHAGWFGPNEWRCSPLTVEFEISRTKEDGSNWDLLDGDVPPDPFGHLTVYRNGKRVDEEPVAKRNNKYDFPAPFFEKSGITLREGDIVMIVLADYDSVSKNDKIGLARLTINGRTTSGSSSNNLFEATVTCEE